MRPITILAIAGALVAGGASAQSGDDDASERSCQSGKGMMMQQGDDDGGCGGRGMKHGKMMGGMPPHVMPKIMFALVDTDGSGGLSLEEVQAAHARLFAAADADGDGELTRDEIRAFMRPDRPRRRDGDDDDE